MGLESRPGGEMVGTPCGDVDGGEDGEPQVCKYGYPRERCCEPLAKSKITGRNIYRCERKEDEELSPYIPLWLLATGAARSIIKPTTKSHTPAHK